MGGDGGRLRILLEPLGGRSFRLYWVGQTTSAYGDQVFLIALALQVLASAVARASSAWSMRRPGARLCCACCSVG